MAKSRDEDGRARGRARRPAALLIAIAIVSTVALAAGGCGGGEDGTSTGTSTGADPGVEQAPASFFGVVPQEVLEAPEYAEMAKAGIKTVRLGFYWQLAQPSQGSDYDFSRTDTAVRSAAENGLTVLPFLYGTPEWVAKSLDKRDCSECTQYAPQSKQALQFWKAYATQVAARYGPGGAFWSENPDVPKMPIRDWQIWNEQNSKTYYLPKPDPKAFEKLLRAASDGIHSQDDDATIVLGGMFGTPGGGAPGHAIAAATFLHALLKIDGAKDEFDGFALHPYSGSVGFVRKQVKIARREMSRSGFPGASLWITEIGWASGGGKSALNVHSKKAQASRVTDAYEMFEQHREQWNVKLVAWFAWEDSHASDDVCFFCSEAGLVDEQGNPKPSYDAYQDVADAG